MEGKNLIAGMAAVGVLLVLFSFYNKPLDNDQYILMRAYEPIGAVTEIVIAYPDGTSERIPLKDMKTEHHEHNLKLINKTLNRFAQEGYRLISTSSSGVGNRTSLVHVETYILVKN